MYPAVLEKMLLALYRIMSNLSAAVFIMPLLPFIFAVRKRRKTFFRRLGFQRYPDTSKMRQKPIWIHALSVGELFSCLPLIQTLRTLLHSYPLLVSVSTLSAYELAEKKLTNCTEGLFYFPYDLEYPVIRCLDSVKPILFLLIETDIWPGFLTQLRRRRIPAFLINARLSPTSLRYTRMLSPLFRPAYAAFQRIYPQSEFQAERFRSLGVDSEKLFLPGNLKFDGLPSPSSSPYLSEWESHFNKLGGRKIFLAGSTHPGEEAILRSVFHALRTKHPSLTMILVPRHPHRAREIVSLFLTDPFRTILLSEPSDTAADIIVVDRLGILTDLYKFADLAFVGGSMVDRGGQNPIEPAAAGKPVIFGPYMSDFPEASRLLIEAGAAVQVRDEDSLAACLDELLEHPDRAEAMGDSGRDVVKTNQGITEKIAADIAAFLDTFADSNPSKAALDSAPIQS